MSEQSFSFSFNLPSPPGAASQPRERVVARPFDACAVTPSEALVRIAHRDSMQRLANADLMILQQCDRLKSMSGHADELCRRLGAASRGQVLESLNKLRKLGLLASERDLTDEFGRAEARGAGTRLQTLYIRSSGRPRALARGLESIAGGRCADAGIARCVVIDDTTDSAARQQIDKLIADADKRTGIRILHFGTDHRSRLADTLSRHADIDRRKLDWFLSTPNGSGQGYGCGINLALLMSAGRRFGLLDDDASLQAVFGPHDADPEHVGICSSNDYRAAFPDPGPVAPPFHEPTGFDPVTAHASWLGRTMAEVISGSGPRPARFADPTPTTLALMRAEGRIRFTVNGVFGDPGTQSPRWLFCQPVQQLDEWMQGEARYRTAIERRWTMRCEPDLRAVVDYSLMTTTLTGIDDSTLMLPTLPQGAGEDALLGELVRFMDPGSLQLGLPWMLKHEPEQPRRWSTEDVARPPGLNAGLFFRHVVDNLARVAHSSEHGARAGLLRQTLYDLARAGDRELRSELVEHVMSMRGAISMQIAQRRAEASLPDYLEREYNRVTESICDSGDPDSARLTEAVGVIRNMARHYAEGLDDWISAWHIAQQIGEAELVDNIIHA